MERVSLITQVVPVSSLKSGIRQQKRNIPERRQRRVLPAGAGLEEEL